MGNVESDLAPDARVDHGDEIRRTVHEIEPAQVRGGDEAGHVADVGVAERNDRRRPVDVGVEQGVVHVLHGGQRLGTPSSIRQRDGEVDRSTARQVQLADRGTGDDHQRTVDVGELTNERQHCRPHRELIAAARVVDGETVRIGPRQRGEVGSDRVCSDHVGRQLGEASILRTALGEQFDDPLPRVGHRQQRAFDPRLVLDDAVEDLIGGGDETEDPSVATETGDVARIEHQPAAGRDHQPITVAEFGGKVPLDLAEGLLASRPKDLGDRAVALFDQLIGVDELIAELIGEQTTDGRLAGAHEAGEHDVAGVRLRHR